VQLVTDDPDAARCPACKVVSTSGKDWVLTRPHDLPSVGGQVAVQWRKRRWWCRTQACERATFTEQVVGPLPPDRRTQLAIALGSVHIHLSSTRQPRGPCRVLTIMRPAAVSLAVILPALVACGPATKAAGLTSTPPVPSAGSTTGAEPTSTSTATSPRIVVTTKPRTPVVVDGARKSLPLVATSAARVAPRPVASVHTAAAAPRATSKASVATHYANCAAARAAGAAPLLKGQPGYSSALDRDGDGVACEV
jgi:hypothetical protein